MYFKTSVFTLKNLAFREKMLKVSLQNDTSYIIHRFLQVVNHNYAKPYAFYPLFFIFWQFAQFFAAFFYTQRPFKLQNLFTMQNNCVTINLSMWRFTSNAAYENFIFHKWRILYETYLRCQGQA